MSIAVRHLNCVFCDLEIRDGIGHNPAPIKSVGRCCFECNYRVVVIARLDALLAHQNND